MTPVNTVCRLAARPVGLPKVSDWQIGDEAVPTPGEGEFLVQVEYLSVDPAMRTWMNAGRSYVAPVEIGEVMRAGGIGRVVESRHPDFATGDEVFGTFGVQRYAVSDGRDVTPVDTTLAPAPVHLGALGISGLTAYFGLLDVGRPQPGQTVVVSGAAGSVGSSAGQIARIKGCRSIGIAGGEDKCRWLVEELGFDAAIDYKAGDLRKQLRTHAPDGIDVFFDNVGGATLEAALSRLARGARVVICGAISQYNASDELRGPANYMQLLVARASMTGFVIFDYADRYREGVVQLADWLRTGELRSREQIIEGTVADFPEVLLGLFRGDNTGKLILALDS
ncbi:MULTISPECIES: NADP-dependent oxidoreductase [unclassified Mycobacterium]|uniref:NADP-dependent oxidoreductase n=1 Tax=unclassified Mycobacterium TaxID=2642494 RepID=UPI0027423212|nr:MULTISPECIES: NADP-dependent oxidoreductase [unclassified Mycobacterium]MDP7703289.1 NADP-dependent oxidoreductase [Mycobacterium sp. TY815]MDP7721697.1 NADP-dependent oxidoreductase [Mycobacterium sp. TY814]